MRRPLILIASDLRQLPSTSVGSLPHQVVFQQYIDFVLNSVGGTPLILPAATIDSDSLSNVLNICSGLLLPGSPSDVGVRHVDGRFLALSPHVRDNARDRATLQAIRYAVLHDIPVLGICRGMQEINCAFGGTLKDLADNAAEGIRHRSNRSKSFFERYDPSHQVEIVGGTYLSSISENEPAGRLFHVNSLHNQAVDLLGEALRVSAVSIDGTIEAIEHTGSRFCLGVQWHCEWGRSSGDLDQRIVHAYARACGTR